MRRLGFVLFFVTVFFASHAQGPGGVTPDLQLWLKANAGVEEASADPAEDGDAVEFWRDQSGNSYDGIQATLGERPLLDLTNTINGNPVLTFDGSNDHFPLNTLNYPAITTPTALTIYAILTTTNTGEGVIISFDRNEYFRFAGDHNNNGGFGLSTTNSSSTVDDFNANGTPEDDGIPHILGGSFDPGVSGTNKFLYFDGTIDNSTDAGTTAFGTGTTRYGFIGLGSEANTFDGSKGPTNYLDGDLAELIYFADALTTTERQQVETYLAIKYGITLSSDTDGDATAFEAGEGDYLAADGATVVWDASLNSAYHNDIAAIAEDADAGLSQASSQSINASALLSVTDNSLVENDYIVWGHNNASLTSSASASSYDRQLDRIWKIEISGATNNLDQLVFDLNSVSVLPSQASDIALLIDDNSSFSTPLEVSGTFVGNVLTLSNVDFSSFAGDIFMTVGFTLPSPAGVGSNLSIWYKADAGVEEAAADAAEDGDIVRFWRDQSGNGNDGQQDDGTERPTFDATNSLNFNPVIAFDGSTHLPIVGLSYDLTTNTLDDFTIYSVVQSTQSNEGIVVSFDRSSFFRLSLNHTGTANFGLSTTVDNTIHDSNSANNASDGSAHLIGADYSIATDDKRLYFNGGVETLSAVHTPVASFLGNTGEVPRFGYVAANSEAGSFNSSDNGSGINGNIAEIIYFEGILSSTDRAKVESYLAVKYGITLSGDYVASDGTTVVWDNSANVGYNNMIAAVGLDNTGALSQSQSQSEAASAILTISEAGLTDGDYVFFGNDNAGLNIVTSGSGSLDGRFERIWKMQLTGGTSTIDQLDFDLSSVVIKPNAVGNYRLLLDDNASFSSPNEIAATSLTNGVLSFTNVNLTGETFLTVALDPDLDNDGIADADDLDDDNDGLLDTDEGSGVTDTDGDGIVDSRDLDSDNDGIGDLYESGAEGAGTALAALDANNDGVIDVGSEGANGLDDRLETVADNGVLAYTISDSDGSGPQDFRDLDTDNNGISDLVESGRSTSIDSDDDGIFEGADADEDGVPDEVDSDDANFGSVLSAQDQDADGTADFRDLDNDADGTEDVDEVGLTDTTPDDGRLDGSTDADGDGVLSGRDDNDAVFGQINLADLLSGSGTDWYSFRSGNWDEPDNWTLDPSGTVRVNPGGLYPNNFVDNVYILNGDEMTLNFNGLVVSSMDIENGGAVDVGTTINHNFNTISGAGTIRIASDEFPAGTATDFISTSGGTVVYVDQSSAADYELSTARTFNNVIINSAANTVVLKADYALNGNLTVASGTLQINDNTSDGFTDNTTPLNLTINGNLTVDATGAITTGNVDASTEIGSSGIFTFHEIELLGDFTNNGSVSFANLNSTSIADGRYRDKYPTAADVDNAVSPVITSAEFGVVELLLTDGSADQLVTLNGTSDFYRIEVAKGTSQTFTAEINASSSANFRLLGRIAMNQSDDSGNTPNIANHRALGLEAGILKLGDNIVIDQISKNDPNGSAPSTQGGNRNYIIDLDAQLWLASNSIVSRANDWGIHPFGKLKVTDDASLTYTGTGQRTILLDNQGVFEMTGGTVDITQFRNKTGSDGAPRGSFIMTGGTLNVGQGAVDGNHAIFSVPWADQNFILKAAVPASPPTINVILDGNRGKDNAAIQIGVTAGNFDVGENNINITHTSNTDYKIVSTAPLYNLIYDNSGTGELIIDDIVDSNGDIPGVGVDPDDNSGTTPSPTQRAVAIEFTNDLTINDGRFNANNQDVTIGNLFTIVDGGEYNPVSNTTSFNGSSPIQRIRLNGSGAILSGGFYNLTFATSGTEKEFGGSLSPVIVRNDLTIGGGVTLNDNGKVIQVNGDISNSGIHETDFASAGRIEVTGGSASHEIGGDGNGRFEILTLDDAANAIAFTADQQVDSVLNLVNGVLDISTYQLTINSTATNPILDDAGGTSNFGTTRMIQTAGNASDGGVNYYFDGATADPGSVLYPIGTNANATVRYTPAQLDLSGIADDGFIQVRTSDTELQTVDLTALSNNMLTYYWRVSHAGFTTIPSVDSYVFTTTDSDDPDGGATPAGLPTNFVPGKVLDESPFTRSQENTGNISGFDITFDGLGAGFTLENANYTAGDGTTTLFVGSPEIYYTANQSTQFPGRNWSATSTWSTVGHYSTTNAGTYPQDGDIVFIGFSPQTTDQSQRSHWVVLNVDVNVAQITFRGDSVQNSGGTWIQRNQSFTPQLVIDENRGAIDLGVISGEGTFNVELDCSVCNADPNVSVVQSAAITADFGDFASVDDSRFDFDFVFGNNVSIYLPTNFPEEYPSLHLKGQNGTERRLVIQEDILVRRDLVLRQNAILRLNDGAAGDIEVLDDVNFTVNGGNDELEFPTSGTARTFTVHGDIQMEDGDNDVIEVLNTTLSGLEHRFRLGGSIDQQSGNTINLFTDNSGGNNVVLELFGTSNGSYSTDDNLIGLYRLEVNKGTDQASSFTFNSDFTLGGLATSATKAVELQNGTLILNNAGIDIDLNSGGGDFTIPATAGLTIQSGTARMTAAGTGVGNGIRLNGKITLDGGNLLLNGGVGADNYIEYGTGGSSEIEISGGNLVVGSQLRRNTLSDDGVINYTQTGGTAVFGVNATPDDNRGVFEIINTGVAGSSSFNLSGAGTVFAIVNGQAAPTQGTFIIGSDVAVSITDDAIIDFGFNGDVFGVTVQNGLNEVFEINSAAAIPNIRIDNANYNSPVLEMVIQPLTVSNNLEILNVGSLVSNNFDLTVNNGFTNNGTYTPGTNTTTFNGGTQLIEGTTASTFNDLVITPTTSMTLNAPITVNGGMVVANGFLDDAGNQISLFGDLTISTSHVSAVGGGISMQGTVAQSINIPDGDAEIDSLIINNNEGIVLNDNAGAAVTLTIDVGLYLANGVLSIGDNRLILDPNAAMDGGAFNADRMISVNGVKKSDGVEKEFLSGVDAAPFTIPVGTPGKYTPVTLDVDGSDDSGSILVKPINAIHPSATGVDALNYYWLVTTNPTTVTNFTGSIAFQYEEEDANGPLQREDDDWINKAARLIAPNWFKPSANLVDTAANIMTFTNSDLSSFGGTTFDGEYTIGNDIPDELAQYRSNTTGIWNLGSNWDLENDGDGLFDDGNGVPQPGTIVIVNTGNEITMTSVTDNDQNIFSLQIDGTLDVADSDGHNFGDVSGTGTLRISNSTLPGGNYDNFFTTSAGALDLSGTGSYTISPDFASGVRGLTISGGGTKTLPAIGLNIGAGGITINDGATLDNAANNNDATVAGDVTINNGIFLLGNTSASLVAQNLSITSGNYISTGAPVNLSGDISINGGTFNAGSGPINLEGNLTLAGAATFNNNNGTVIFDGSSDQTITGDYSTEDFNNLTVAKGGGEVVLAASAVVNIANTLSLNGGNINTQATGAVLRLLNGVGSISRTTGYINGPLQVDLTDNDAFSFPVGKSGRYKPLDITIQNGSQPVNPVTWLVEYFVGSASGFSSGENSGIDLNLIETNADPDEQVVTIYGGEYWKIDTGPGVATTDNITLDVSNIGLSTDNINDQQVQVMVWDQAGTEWDHLGGVSSGSPTAASMVSTLPLSFSEHIITSGFESDVILPVELLSFSGVAENNNVVLTWETASELNNDYFEVQRSRDGVNFEAIGVVDGNGTTDQVIAYQLIDYNPGIGDNYYRLRQVDFDGAEEYHKIIKVDNSFFGRALEANIYPNPASQDNLNLRITSGDDYNKISVRLVDLSGQVYYEEILDASLSFDQRILPVRRMNPGMYFMLVQQGEEVSKQKIIIR